jgi:O-methyltransferase
MALTCPERSVWLFDSWEGCPEPTEHDVDWLGVVGKQGDFTASEHETRILLYDTLGLSPDRVKMVRGWFSETLDCTVDEIGQIGLLHLDSDWYSSTREALEATYEHVVSGGVIVIDDYGAWRGCRDAVDEFRGSRRIDQELHRFDETQAWFLKTP